VFYFVLRRSWRLRPRRSCEFALCVVLAGTNEGLASPRVLERARLGVAIPGNLAGSIIVEIFHCDEDGDVEQVARTSKEIYRVCDCSFLSQLTCIYILHAYYNCAHLLHA